MSGPTVHASAVLAGAKGVLIRGAPGAGKSLLAWRIIEAAGSGLLRFARLVGDDRVRLEAAHGRLLVRPAPALSGLIEVRGLGIRSLPAEPAAVVGLVVDLGAGDAVRLPEPADRMVALCGIPVPRLAVAAGVDPLPLVTALFRTGASEHT